MLPAKSSCPGTDLRDSINRAIQQGLQALYKPEPKTLSVWADEHFYLSPESSSVEGPWETLPPQKGIMDCISNDDIEIVSWRKAARTGYTKIIVIAMLYFAEHRKRNVVVFQPTDGDAEEFVKDEVNPAIRDVDVVRDIFPSYDKKSKDNTLSKKVFIGSTLDIRGGQSPRNYRRLTKDVAIYDELSGFVRDVGGEGKPTDLGDVRITTSSFPKSIRGSTPKTEGSCQITDSLNEADVIFEYHVPCPKCKELQLLEWGGRDAEFGIKWENKDPKTAHYVCRHCGKKFFYPDLTVIWAKGKWVAKDGEWIDEHGDIRSPAGDVIDPPPRHVGFDRYSSLYSIFFTWPQMVHAYLQAVEKATEGDDTKLKVFINTRLGETWKEEVAVKPSNEILYSRRENYGGDCPNQVVFITGGVDVQDDRFEFEICGHGVDEQTWSLEYQVLLGNLSNQSVWDILAEMLRKQYTRNDGLILPVSRVCIDSGGHYTDEVYAFSKKSGIHWVIPTKGASTYGGPLADFPKKPKKGVHLTQVNTVNVKDLIYNRLAIKEVGPGYCHFPNKDDMYNEAYFKMLTAEHKKLDYSRGRPVYKYITPNGVRNEALDCRAGNLVALRISQQFFGLDLKTVQPVQRDDRPKQPERRKSNFWSR
jgi:terminase, large subunit